MLRRCLLRLKVVETRKGIERASPRPFGTWAVSTISGVFSIGLASGPPLGEEPASGAVSALGALTGATSGVTSDGIFGMLRNVCAMDARRHGTSCGSFDGVVMIARALLLSWSTQDEETRGGERRGNGALD